MTIKAGGSENETMVPHRRRFFFFPFHTLENPSALERELKAKVPAAAPGVLGCRDPPQDQRLGLGLALWLLSNVRRITAWCRAFRSQTHPRWRDKIGSALRRRAADLVFLQLLPPLLLHGSSSPLLLNPLLLQLPPLLLQLLLVVLPGPLLARLPLRLLDGCSAARSQAGD